MLADLISQVESESVVKIPAINASYVVPLKFGELVMLSDFIQRFSLNLPDSFSGNRENFSDFFQSVSYAVSQTETHIQYLLFSDGQIGDNFIDVSFQYFPGRGH